MNDWGFAVEIGGNRERIYFYEINSDEFKIIKISLVFGLSRRCTNRRFFRGYAKEDGTPA
jgi:hypothetical protein